VWTVVAGIQVDLVNLLDLQLLGTDEKSDDDEERAIVDDHRNHKDLDTADGESETSLLSQYSSLFNLNKLYFHQHNG